MSQARIAAVVYEPGKGETVDQLLWSLAERLRGAGLALAGTVQRARDRVDRCRCDMIMAELRTGSELQISEDRGREASGCRLDSRALEQIAGSVMAVLEEGADLLIVNKFGKREGEGAGLRPAIAAAVARGIPVLAAVNRDSLAAWLEFTDGMAVELPADAERVMAWVMDLLRADAQVAAAAR